MMKNPLDEFCEKIEELMGKTGGVRGEFPGRSSAATFGRWRPRF